MKPINIQVTQHLGVGGLEKLVLDIQKFAKTHDVHIAIIEANYEESVKENPAIETVKSKLHFLDKPPGIQLSFIFKLKRLFQQLKASVIHTHHIGPLFYGGIAARLAKIPTLIYTEHDIWHLNNRKQYLLQYALFKLINPTIIADSNYVAEELKEKFANLSPSVIHNGINVEKFSPGDKSLARKALNINHQGPIIGCAARLEQVKGQHILVQALTQLNDNIHVVFAGVGSEAESLHKQVNSLGLQSRCHFLGSVNNMTAFYQSLDLFCLPSLNEGLPLAPLEAQACDIPVVLTNVGAGNESLCPDTGTCVAPNNVNALANALRLRLNNPIHKSPREFIISERNLLNLVEQYEQL